MLIQYNTNKTQWSSKSKVLSQFHFEEFEGLKVVVNCEKKVSWKQERRRKAFFVDQKRARDGKRGRPS